MGELDAGNGERMSQDGQYSLYVIKLRKGVLRSRTFRRENPVGLFGPVRVSVGPVYVSIQSGRCEHRFAARLADRAPYQ
jgi:hypothetical protein